MEGFKCFKCNRPWSGIGGYCVECRTLESIEKLNSSSRSRSQRSLVFQIYHYKELTDEQIFDIYGQEDGKIEIQKRDERIAHGKAQFRRLVWNLLIWGTVINVLTGFVILNALWWVAKVMFFLSIGWIIGWYPDI